MKFLFEFFPPLTGIYFRVPKIERNGAMKMCGICMTLTLSANICKKNINEHFNKLLGDNDA